MENKSLVHQCFHCGNKGIQEVVGSHNSQFGGPKYDSYGIQIDQELFESIDWLLLCCPVCKMVTLVQKYSNECTRNPQTGDIVYEDKVLYPECHFSYEGVPEEVNSAFEAALRVRNIDTAICLLSLRRVLEAICIDRGATGNTLNQMINDMLNRGVLPQIMKDACWIIRQLGNSAAHADGTVFMTSEVEQTIEFVRTIIQYLYTLPVQMKKLKSHIDQERKENVPKDTI